MSISDFVLIITWCSIIKTSDSRNTKSFFSSIGYISFAEGMVIFWTHKGLYYDSPIDYCLTDTITYTEYLQHNFTSWVIWPEWNERYTRPCLALLQRCLLFWDFFEYEILSSDSLDYMGQYFQVFYILLLQFAGANNWVSFLEVRCTRWATFQGIYHWTLKIFTNITDGHNFLDVISYDLACLCLPWHPDTLHLLYIMPN